MADSTDTRLQRQQDYQQFHIGIYITLASALIGASLFKDRFSLTPCAEDLLFAVVAWLFLAGGCAGFATANLPEHTRYSEWRNRKVGFGLLGRELPQPRLGPKDWESLEHFFFWAPMVAFLCLGGVLIFAKK